MAEVAKNITYFVFGNFLYEVSYHMLIVSILLALFAWYILRQTPKRERPLSFEEEEELIKEWEPEDLVPEHEIDPLEPSPRVVTSIAGKYMMVNNNRCLNLATHNYLCATENQEVISKASNSISKYGVGSCGPRGFYGTVDVHLTLEEKLAEFMQVEEACVYSYGFSTMASAIPAYCKRGDVIFVDQAVNFSIQKGLDASRSQIIFFRHNDMEDLERLIINQEDLASRNVKKSTKTRKFLIAEGIYLNTGNICDLPGLVRLRKQYKLRMFVDESISFCVLGQNGRGVNEHFDIPVEEVDLRVGSMECSLGSIGGFCCGASFIVEHQRLSGLGYCFSASLPPLLAVAALTVLEQVKKEPEVFATLQSVCQQFHDRLTKITGVQVSGNELSPVQHLYLNQKYNEKVHKSILNNIVDYCLTKGIAIVRPAYLDSIEKFTPKASIRLTVNKDLTVAEMDNACAVIQEAVLKFKV